MVDTIIVKVSSKKKEVEIICFKATSSSLFSAVYFITPFCAPLVEKPWQLIKKTSKISGECHSLWKQKNKL